MTPASGVRVGVDSEEGDQSFLGKFPPQPSHTATQRASLFDDILSDVHNADTFHDRCFPYDASLQLNRMVAQTARLPVGGTFTQLSCMTSELKTKSMPPFRLHIFCPNSAVQAKVKLFSP